MKAEPLNKTLLVIDDDKTFCESVRLYFEEMGHTVLYAHSRDEGLKICSQIKVDTVLLDQKLPDAKGVDLCSPILSYYDQTKIIFITAYPSFSNALEAIRAGAHDYLSKPFELEELQLAVERSLKTSDLERLEQIQKYKSNKEKAETIIIGSDGDLASIWQIVESAASNEAPVLITGETGTGKNQLAKYIHYSQSCRKGPFVSVNCAALPENLMEAELFGYEKGSFTGAVSMKKGFFEMAEGGTLFLDEIGAIPMNLQAKLLGALDDKKIRRIGGELARPVDVRIIAATNENLEHGFRQKAMREDLYFRLSIIRIHIPPLRERVNDIPRLCRYFIRSIAGRNGLEISDTEMEILCRYAWPGNVRELKNIVERGLILCRGTTLKLASLLSEDEAIASKRMQSESNDAELTTLKEVERDYITLALRKMVGNRSKAADALGISRSTLKRKIKEYNIPY